MMVVLNNDLIKVMSVGFIAPLIVLASSYASYVVLALLILSEHRKHLIAVNPFSTGQLTIAFCKGEFV